MVGGTGILVQPLGPGAFQPFLHLLMVDKSRLLKEHFGVFHDDEKGNTAHPESARQLGNAFGVDFEHNRAPLHRFRDQFNFGSGQFARPTPRGPEVDQHRNFGPGDDFLEFLHPNVYRLVDGWEHVLAFSALACI